MKRFFFLIVFAISLSCVSINSINAQTPADKEARRNATREKLRTLLQDSGPKKGIEVAFRQSDKQPYNFVGVKRGGFKNAEGFEIVIGVSNDDTIGFRIYPYYHGTYINIDKARNSVALMHQLLNLNDHNFLFWGADDTGDIFAGYTFTLESGFPDKSLEIVLYSITPLDEFVGKMKPNIDGSMADH